MTTASDTAFQFPADLQRAMKHRLANRIFKGLSQSTANKDRCECCDRRVGEEQVEMSRCYSPKKELVFLGSGVPLLFVFIQNGITILTVFTLVFSIYAIITNLKGNSCVTDKLCEDDTFDKLSLSNKIHDNQSIMIQTYLISGFLLLYLFLTQYLIYRIRKNNKICDEIINSPSDYSIIIKNLPEIVDEKDIERLVVQHRRLLNYDQKERTKNLSIRKIILSYSLKDYVKERQQQEEQFIKLKKKDEDAVFHFTPISKPTKTASIAIVVFDSQMSKEMFFDDHSTEGCNNLFVDWCASPSSFQINGKTVDIKRAPQPDDILWENTDIPKSRVYRNTFFSYFFGIIILLIGGIIQYFLQYFQIKITDPTINGYFSYITSIAVTIFNGIIVNFLTFFTKLQGHQTKSDLNKSLMIKICFYSFFNAGIFYSLANILAQSVSNFDLQDGFAYEVTLFSIMNAFPPNLISLIMGKLEFPAFIFRFLLKKGYLKYTQKQANQLFELATVDFTVHYAYVIKTIWITCFYAPFAPVVVPISIAGLTFFYFSQAELFRTSYSAPNMLSMSITNAAIRLLDFTGIMLAIGQFLVVFYIKYNYSGVWTVTEQVGLALSLILSILLIIIPSININKRLIPFQNKYDNPLQYTAALKEFQATYEGTNPLSDPTEKIRRSDINLMKYLRIFANTEMEMIDPSRTISNPLLGMNYLQNSPHNGSSFDQKTF